MSNTSLRNITNNFQDVRLISMASWRAAAEFAGRDKGGPYVVVQEGYDPQDMRVVADEFVLGRSGNWLSLSFFYRMPVEQRRAEFIFATAAEVMTLMETLPPRVGVIRPENADAGSSAPADEFATAFLQAKNNPAPPAAG